MNRSTPGLPVHHQLPEFTQTHVDAIQPSHPLSSPSPPAHNPSQHQSLFRWVNSSHEVAKVLEFQPEHQSFQWTPRIGLLAVQGTHKSLLQHHFSKTSILLHSAFFTVQYSYPYMTTGKTIALTRQVFVGKVIPLFFNMLSRLVIKWRKTEWERLEISSRKLPTKGSFHAKMGLIKDRNGMDPTEAEDIKRWQEYTDLYKKDLHAPDNHDGKITDLGPDILECEVKWALKSITMNKASGGDGMPVELFQILKDDAVKVLHSICQHIWKTQQWPQD